MTSYFSKLDSSSICLSLCHRQLFLYILDKIWKSIYVSCLDKLYWTRNAYSSSPLFISETILELFYCQFNAFFLVSCDHVSLLEKTVHSWICCLFFLKPVLGIKTFKVNIQMFIMIYLSSFCKYVRPCLWPLPNIEYTDNVTFIYLRCWLICRLVYLHLLY